MSNRGLQLLAFVLLALLILYTVTTAGAAVGGV